MGIEPTSEAWEVQNRILIAEAVVKDAVAAYL